MRENIGLYKAKIKDKNEWIEGFYTQIIFSRDCFENSIVLNGHFIISKDEWWVEIDPETLCECTGLKDKNNKLVFENDKLRCAVEDPCTGKIYKYFDCIVKYCKTTNAWGWYGIDERSVLNKIPPQQNYIEVIGNKFSEVESE